MNIEHVLQQEYESLSGGEKTRIELVKLLVSNVDVLCMNDPTNHLDIQSCEILEDVLNAYDGTLLIVSHDRYFLNALNTNVFEMKNIEEYLTI